MSHVSSIEGHDTRQLLAFAKTAEASMHTCVEGRMETVWPISNNTSLVTRSLTLNAETLYPIISVQYILYTVLQLYY